MCSFQLDTMYILPSGIQVKNLSTGKVIPEKCYVFDFNSSFITLCDSLCSLNTTISISYRVLHLPLNYSYQHKDSSLSDPKADTMYSLPLYKPFLPYGSDGLIKDGIISRGISVGNTQGASLQSALDIRLSGSLYNDVEILAVITDNSIPVQPDGNTQQLQEFDKVFIELKKNQTGLRVGDIDLNKPGGYFMNYTKKTQGGAFYTTSVTDHALFSSPDSKQSVRASAGISKGRFSRNSFQGLNGNQGPYKLSGAENEIFIVVLAGTERVFINGELMERGQNYDYVIDYNTAELFFTPNRIITSDSRIVIEFEYSDKNYVRSLLAGNYEYSDSKAVFRLNFYSEQDAKNQPLQQELDEDDRFLLQQAGDNPFGAVAPGWDSLGFSGDFVLYALRDSLGFDSVFVYSVHPDSAVYKVSFSFVGQEKGNYVQTPSTANGRVFKWVKPEVGLPQGDHEPYIILIAPKKQQMVTTGFDYQFSDKMIGGIELAISHHDLNTFSSIDNHDNTGTAGRIYLKHTTLFQKDSLRPVYTFLKQISYEFTEARFVHIDRFRPVEFSRDWNIRPDETSSNDHIVSLNLALLRQKASLISLQSDYFLNIRNFTGLKNRLDIDYKKSIFRVQNRMMYMTSQYTGYQTSFFRQKGFVSATLGPLIAGTAIEQEINLFKITGDSLINNSFDFFEYEPFLASSDSSKIHFRTWYKQRVSRKPLDGILRDAMASQEFGGKVNADLGAANRLAITGAFRTTNVKNPLLTDFQDDKSIISRFEHHLNLFGGAITSFLFYETGSGLESKKDFSYIEVAPGQGQYAWIDYNQNGVREIDEFEPANYQDEASFIRILIPTNEYIRAYTLQLNETFIVEPSRIWRNDTLSWKKILSRFSNRFQFSLGKKTTSDLASDRFFPLLDALSDSSLITLNSSLSNTFFFNRAHPVFSIRYRYADLANKSLMVNGIEFRRVRTNELRFVWNINKSIGTETELRQAIKSNESEMSLTRNHQVLSYEIMPSFNIQPSVKHRYSMHSRYRVSENTLSGRDEKSSIVSAGPEVRFPFQDIHTINLRFIWHRISYNSPTNTPLAF
jgi:hypothetical protein